MAGITATITVPGGRAGTITTMAGTIIIIGATITTTIIAVITGTDLA